MKRVAAALFLLSLASTTAACFHPCGTYWHGQFGHPTMTTDDVSGPHDARVRAESEGAKGSISTNQPSLY